MLYYTSLLFITNVIHSSFVCCFDCEYATLILTSTSILHHAKLYDNYIGKRIVYYCDFSSVFSIFFAGLYKLYTIQNIIGFTSTMKLNIASLVVTTALGTTTVFFDNYLKAFKINWRNIHAGFHLLSCVTGHLLLLNYKKAYPNKCYSCPANGMGTTALY